MPGEVFELAILLSLKDAASGKLDHVREELRATGKDGRAMLQTFEQLRGNLKRGLAIGGVGLGTLGALRGGVKSAGDFEAATTELRLAVQQLGKDGSTDLSKLNDQMGRFEQLGMKLGNTLPGSTQDFLEMFTVLKQGGLQTETILGGAGAAVANLAVVTGSVPKDLAKEYAQFGEQFQLKPEEFKKSADLISRLYRATGLESSELIQGSKFFQLRAGLPLGLKGLQGAEQGGRLLATLRTFGLEGGVGGRELADFVIGLKFNKKNQITALQGLHKQGIDLQFFGKKGEFLGFDNLFKQMEKLRHLSTEKSLDINEKLFGKEAMGVAAAFTQAGVEGWNRINARIDSVPPLQDQINQKTATYNAKLENILGTLENIKATAFTPLLDQLKPGLDKVNALAGSVQELAKGHPEATKLIADFAVLAGVTLTVTGGIKAMSAAYKLWRIASAVGAGEQTLLNFLSNTGTSAAATGTELAAAGTKAGRLKGALSSLASSPFKVVLTLAVVGFTIEQIMALVEAKKDLDKANTGLDKTAALDFHATQHARESFTKRGQPVPSEIYHSSAQAALGTLNRDRELEYAFDPSRESWFHKLAFMGQNPFGQTARVKTKEDITAYERDPRGYKERHAAEEIKRRAPQLAIPEVMQDVRKMIDSWKLPADSRSSLDRVLQLAQPDAFKQATQPIAQELQQLSGQVTPVTQSFNQLQMPLGQLPPSFANAGGAARSFADQANSAADRISSIKIEIPSATVAPVAGNQPQSQPPANTQSSIVPSRFSAGRPAEPRNELAELNTKLFRQRAEAPDFYPQIHVESANTERAKFNQPAPITISSFRGDSRNGLTELSAKLLARPREAPEFYPQIQINSVAAPTTPRLSVADERAMVVPERAPVRIATEAFAPVNARPVERRRAHFSEEAASSILTASSRGAAGASNGGVESVEQGAFHYSPKIDLHVHGGDSKSASRLREEFAGLLDEHSKHIERIISKRDQSRLERA